MRAVVAGAGLAGAAAAWRLAAGGDDVTLVEAFTPAHGGGSSHGSARIFRHAYPDLFHAELTVRALEQWRELEDAAGVSLVRQTGGLDFGIHRDLDGIASSLSALGLEHERLTRDAARERFPHIAFDTDAVWHAGAGVLDADLAVHSMVRLATEAGAEVITGEPVAGVSRQGSEWVVDLGDRQLTADVVVFAVGAWLPELAAGLPIPALPALTVSQQNAFFFERPAELADWPIFVHKGDLSVYSLPAGRDLPAAFKIAEHDGGSRTTASGRDGVVDAAARERIIGYVTEFLPAVRPEPLAAQTCLYTSTPSENFLIDSFDGLVIASPCSGHGAKFGPLTGSIIADVARGGRAPEPFLLASH
ncbi:FAD-dependent oxidoreductase [Schumannella luteola]